MTVPLMNPWNVVSSRVIEETVSSPYTITLMWTSSVPVNLTSPAVTFP